MSDKNSDKSKRETEAHELRRDVRREEAGQRRQQRKDACEARHLEHEEKRETSELIDLSNRLENQEAHSDGPAFDNPTDDALRATVETAESEKILHLGDEVDEQGATIEHNLQREEAEQSGGEASETRHSRKRQRRNLRSPNARRTRTPTTSRRASRAGSSRRSRRRSVCSACISAISRANTT